MPGAGSAIGTAIASFATGFLNEKARQLELKKRQKLEADQAKEASWRAFVFTVAKNPEKYPKYAQQFAANPQMIENAVGKEHVPFFQKRFASASSQTMLQKYAPILQALGVKLNLPGQQQQAAPSQALPSRPPALPSVRKPTQPQSQQQQKQELLTEPVQQPQTTAPPQALTLPEPVKQVEGITIGENGLTIRLGDQSTPAQRGAAFVMQTIAQDPTQFDEALAQLSQQGITITPEQHRVLSGGATASLITRNRQALQQQYPQATQTQLDQAALQATVQQMGGFISADTATNLLKAMQDPAVAAGAVRAAQNTADQLSAITPLAAQAASAETQRAATRAGLEAGARTRATQREQVTPLAGQIRQQEVTQAGQTRVATEQAERQVQQGDPIPLQTAKTFGLPPNTTIGAFREMQLNTISESVIKQAENAQSTLATLDKLEQLFLLGKPYESPVEARLKGFMKNVAGSTGFNPNVALYNDAKEAFLAAMAAAGGETTPRFSDQDIERARNNMPSYSHSQAEGRARIQIVKDIVRDAYIRARDVRQELTQPGQAPDSPPEPQEWQSGSGNIKRFRRID